MPALTGEIEISNMALSVLGAATIVAFTDASREARLAEQHYAPARDYLLRTYTWKCALRRVSLAALTPAPTFGYARAFQLPADFLRLKHTSDAESDTFRLEGKTILSDDITMQINYVRRVENVAEMDEGLKHAIAMRMAMLMARSLTADSSVMDRAAGLYQDALAEAQLADAREHPQTDAIEPTEWLGGRDGAPPQRRIAPPA